MLVAHDRIIGNPIPITHDGLATVLGVWRPNVTDALATLERDGAVSRTRGTIRVLDRARLSEHACECHKQIDDRFAWYASLPRYRHYVELEPARAAPLRRPATGRRPRAVHPSPLGGRPRAGAPFPQHGGDGPVSSAVTYDGG